MLLCCAQPRSPVETAALQRPETSITPRIHSRVRPKRRLDSPAASGSCASTGCKKKVAGSWDFLSNLHQRQEVLPLTDYLVEKCDLKRGLIAIR